MYLTHKELIEQEVIDETICNRCGKSIRKYAGCLKANIQWDYDNSIFPEENHQFEVCEECISKWFKTFKYSPSGFNHLDNQEDSQIMFDSWKTMSSILNKTK